MTRVGSQRHNIYIFKSLYPSTKGVCRFIWRPGRVITMAATNIHLLTYLLIYLLTPYSKVLLEKLSGSQLSNSTCILWNPKVLYHIHKCPPPAPILSQIIPCYPPNPQFLKTIVILSSHLSLSPPSGLFPLGFPTTNHVCTSPHPHTCYMPRPCHSSRFVHPNNNWS